MHHASPHRTIVFPSLIPAELTWRSRGALLGLVVLLHGLVAWLVLQAPVAPLTFSEPTLITAQLLLDAPAPQSFTMAAHHAEPARSRHEAQTPVREAQYQREPVVRASPPAPVLVSPKLAQPLEPVAPMVDSRAPPTAQAATMPLAIRGQKDVAGESPSVAERGRTDQKDQSISPADYLIKPPNEYPADAYDQGESGTVRFEVLVDENGRPEDFKIVHGSGSPRLDRQARRNVMRARFKPRLENGQLWKGWLHGQMTFTAPD
jgi:TonB family protein